MNVALATGNIGRPGGGCVRMGGHQEGYSRPSDAHVGKPAAYVDKLLIEGKGGVHHIWACDHYKTTLNAHKFKQTYKKRTDIVKDAMNAVPAGDKPALVAAIVDAIKKGGLFAVDVDIVPTKIGEACHVWLPAATSGEMNLTSMNGERRMRLTERYMDPPGESMPDCLIAARIANNMERVLRDLGDAKYADQFKGFDWKTEEDAFMDGYAKHEKGGEFVTYERLRAMGTNGFQEPATAFTGRQDRRHQTSLRRRQIRRQGRQGHLHGSEVARPAGARQGGAEEEVQIPGQQRPHQPRLAKRLPRPGQRVRHGPVALSVHRDEPGRHGRAEGRGAAIWSRSTTTTARPRPWSIPRPPPRRARPSCCSRIPTGVQGNVVNAGTNELILPNYKQTWANVRKARLGAGEREAPELQEPGIQNGLMFLPEPDPRRPVPARPPSSSPPRVRHGSCGHRDGLRRIQYRKGFEIDALLLGICDELRLRGLHIGGVLQSSYGARGQCAASVLVTDLRSGEVFDIWDHRGTGARGCRLDESGLLDAEPAINDAIAANVDLLVVNRFGRAESLGRGLIGSFTAAIEAGIPILTAVRPPYDEAWRAFHGGIGCELMAEPGIAMTWALSVTKPSSVRASRVA